MMNKGVVVSARIEPELKSSAEQVFKGMGLTTTQAIRLFYRQVDLQHGLPFLIEKPNEITRQALADARNRRTLETFESAEALFADLGI